MSLNNVRIVILILVVAVMLFLTRWIMKAFWRRVSQRQDLMTLVLILGVLVTTLFLPGLFLACLNGWLFDRSANPFVFVAPELAWLIGTLALSLYYKAKYWDGRRSTEPSSSHL